MRPEDEKELIAQCRKGKASAQRALYEHYARSMYAVCLRYVRTTAEAEDLLQEGFVKVFTKLHTFKGETSIVHWIRRIMINTALNHIRGQVQFTPLPEEADLHTAEAPVALEHLELADCLSALRELPEGYRTVFNLYVIEGYAHAEIAELLGISEGTSKSQLARARRVLNERLATRNELPALSA